MTLESVKQMGERAGDSLRAAKHYIADAKETAVDHARKGARTVDDYAHENAWQAAGLAATAGLLIGWLLGRNSK